MKKVNQILVLVALLVGTISSYAQRPSGGPKPSPEKIIKYLDANDDGKLSKEEAANARNGKLAENFEMFDANKDDFIDLEELKSAFDKRKNRNK